MLCRVKWHRQSRRQHKALARRSRFLILLHIIKIKALLQVTNLQECFSHIVMLFYVCYVFFFPFVFWFRVFCGVSNDDGT